MQFNCVFALSAVNRDRRGPRLRASVKEGKKSAPKYKLKALLRNIGRRCVKQNSVNAKVVCFAQISLRKKKQETCMICRRLAPPTAVDIYNSYNQDSTKHEDYCSMYTQLYSPVALTLKNSVRAVAQHALVQCCERLCGTALNKLVDSSMLPDCTL